MKIILVGAGRFGFEVKSWINSFDSGWTFSGFIDDISGHQDVIEPIVGHVPRADHFYMVCLGDGAARHRLGENLRKAGANLVTLISPQTLSIAPLQSTVVGGIFLGYQTIANNVTIGDFPLVHGFTCIGHDVKIGKGVSIEAHSFIGGGVSIGDFVTVHPRSVLLPDIKVGKNSTIGAGSVVTADVPDSVTVFGAPAKIIFRK